MPLIVQMFLIYLALPLVRVNGHPAVHLDVAARRFYLFGGTFNAQDFWIVIFLLAPLLFLLAISFCSTGTYGEIEPPLTTEHYARFAGFGSFQRRGFRHRFRDEYLRQCRYGADDDHVRCPVF